MRNAGGVETNCDKVLGSLDTTKRKWHVCATIPNFLAHELPSRAEGLRLLELDEHRDGHLRLQLREGDNHRIARVQMRRSGSAEPSTTMSRPAAPIVCLRSR